MRKLIILATTLMPTAALAGGYVIPNETARDLGLSQAAVADETGAEALLLNVAALAGQDGLDVSASGEALINRTDWSDPSLGTARMNPQTNLPPAASVSLGDHLSNGMGWGVGVGFGVPAGGSLVWPSGWQGQEYIQSVTQRVYAMAIGAAFQPVPAVKIGASFVRYQSEEELHQGVNYLDHYGDAHLGLTGGASSFSVAGEFKIPTIPLQLGITYKHSGNTTLNGDVHFSDVPPGLQAMLHDQKVTEAFIIPAELHVGAAYEVIPRLKVMGTYTFERWSPYVSDTFVGADGFTVVVPRNYTNAHVYRLGGEWARVPFLPALTLRLGGLRSVSSQPAATVSPSLSDGNSWAVSLGAGYDVMSNLRVDLGWQHAFFDDVTAMGTETLPGTYKTQVDLVSIGVNWRVDVLGSRAAH